MHLAVSILEKEAFEKGFVDRGDIFALEVARAVLAPLVEHAAAMATDPGPRPHAGVCVGTDPAWAAALQTALRDPAVQAALLEQGAEPAPTTHLCSTCDLCHAPLAVPAAELAPPSVPPSVAPAAAHPRDTVRLMAASLERPPRA
jgi:hypothetical protein